MINLQEGKFEVSDQEILKNALKLFHSRTKIRNPGKYPVLKIKMINSQVGKFELSDQKILKNALK